MSNLDLWLRHTDTECCQFYCLSATRRNEVFYEYIEVGVSVDMKINYANIANITISLTTLWLIVTDTEYKIKVSKQNTNP